MKSIDIPSNGVDLVKRTIDVWTSKYEVDRDGEVVKPTAFEKHLDVYLSNGPLLLFHSHKSLPVGKILEVKIFPEEGVWSKFYITKNVIGDEILTLANEGCLNGVSPGFVPIVFEDNPPLHKIPQHVLKTSMGRKVKRLYSEVEWVETSLLPIPSNRSALIDRASKGNNIASLIVKSFDIEKQSDLEIIIKEWMDAQKPVYTLKSLLNWDESEHPRDNSGMFTEKPHVSAVLDPIQESVYHPIGTSSTKSQNQMSFEQSKKMDEANNKLQDISTNTNMMRRDMKDVKDQGSWSTWFKKYGVIAASAVGLYMLVKYGKKVPTVKSIKSPEEEVGRVLELIKDFLDKGKELGIQESEDYKKMEKFYTDTISKIDEIKPKGLSNLLIVTKEMTAETFVEEEHPRHTDGKFRKKSEGSGVKKTKPQEISEEIKVESSPRTLSSLLITTKEITKEEFKEEEHPRASDGKFTDKVGGDSGSTITPEKGSWGGYRASSGRLPKDPIEAKQRLEEKIKKSKPEINDDELKKEIEDYAVKNRKPDLLLATTNPVAYQQKKEKEMMEAMASSYKKTSVNGVRVPDIDSSDDTEQLKRDTKTSVSVWKKEVHQAKDIKEAIDTYNSKEAEKDEVRKARIILGAAIVGSALLAGKILLSKPSLSKAGFTYDPALDKAGSIRTMFSSDTIPDPLKVGKATWFRWLKTIEPPKGPIGKFTDRSHTIYESEIGSFQRVISSAIGKIMGKNPDEVLALGPGIKGMRGRFGLGSYYKIGRSENYIPRPFDSDAITGLRIINKDRKFNVFNLALINKVIGDSNLPGKAPAGLRRVQRGSKYFWEFQDKVGELKFLQYAKQKNLIQNVKVGVKDLDSYLKSVRTTGGKLDPKKIGNINITYDPVRSAIPEQIMRRWPDKARTKFKESADTFESTALWLGHTAIPMTSRKVIAALVPFAGVGTTSAFYFAKDFDTFARAVDIFSKTEGEGEQNKILSDSISAYNESKKDSKDIDKQIKLEKAQEKNARAKSTLEVIRDSAIEKLISELKIRKDLEGFVTEYSLTPEVIRKRFNKRMREEMGYSDNEEGMLRLTAALKDPKVVKDILQRIAAEELKGKKSGKDTNEESSFTHNYDFSTENQRNIREEIENEKNKKAKEFSDYVMKMYESLDNEEEESDQEFLSLDQMTSLAAYEITNMISDLSSCCRDMIENGVPGHSDYEEISQILTEIYTYMKDQAKIVISEDNKIVKSFDKNESLSDNAGNEVTPDPNEICKICGKVATVEHISRCSNPKCSYSFIAGLEKKE